MQTPTKGLQGTIPTQGSLVMSLTPPPARSREEALQRQVARAREELIQVRRDRDRLAQAQQTTRKSAATSHVDQVIQAATISALRDECMRQEGEILRLKERIHVMEHDKRL